MNQTGGEIRFILPDRWGAEGVQGKVSIQIYYTLEH
jgi:hypothetical protein